MFILALYPEFVGSNVGNGIVLCFVLDVSSKKRIILLIFSFLKCV